MNEEPVNFLQRAINMNEGDNTLFVSKKVDYFIPYFLKSDNQAHLQRVFFDPAKGQAHNHKLILCHKMQVVVLSISESQKEFIEESVIPLPFESSDLNPVDDADVRSEVRKRFIYCQETKTLRTYNKLAHSLSKKYQLGFHEVGFGDHNQSARKLIGLRWIKPSINNCSERVIVSNNSSYRIYVRNRVLEIEGLEIKHSFLTPKTIAMRPKVFATINHTNVKKILKDAYHKLPQKEKELYDEVDWVSEFKRYTTKESVTFISKHPKFSYLIFRIFRRFAVIKVYDKARMKMLRTVVIELEPILKKALLKQKIIPRKLEEADFDLQEVNLASDELFMTGRVFVQNVPKDMNGFYNFTLRVKNYLLKGKSFKFNLIFKDGINKEETILNEGELNHCHYSITDDQISIKRGIFQMTKKGKPKKVASFEVKKSHPLIEKSGYMEKFGLIPGTELAFLADQRFIYLANVKTQQLNSKFMHSAFKNIAKMEKGNKLCFGLFGKFSPRLGVLQLFKVSDRKVKYLKDINIKSILKKKLKPAQDRLGYLMRVRMAESKRRGEISLLCLLSICKNRSVEKNVNYCSVIHLDKESLEPKESFIMEADQLVKGYIDLWEFYFSYNAERDYWFSNYKNWVARDKEVCLQRVQIGHGLKNKFSNQTLPVCRLHQVLNKKKIQWFHIENNRLFMELDDVKFGRRQLMALGMKASTKFEEQKIADLDLGGGNSKYFHDQSGELNFLVFIRDKQSSRLEICLADKNLIVFRRLKAELEEFPLFMKGAQFYADLIPEVVCGSSLIIKFSKRYDSFRMMEWYSRRRIEGSPGFFFVLDTQNLNLRRIVEERGDDMPEFEGGARNVHGELRLRFWTDEYLILNNFECRLN